MDHESIICRALIDNPKDFPIELSVKDFSVPGCRDLIKIYNELLFKGELISPYILISEFGNSHSKDFINLLSKVKVPNPEDLRYSYQQLREKSFYRQTSALLFSLESSYAVTCNAISSGRIVAEKLEGLLCDYDSHDDTETMVSWSNSLDNGKPVIEFKSGYSSVDEYISGMARGGITVIGGRPGHGKTRLMIDMLYKQWENGCKVLIFENELSDILMYSLVAARASGIDSRKILEGRLTLEQKQIIKEIMSGISESKRFLLEFYSPQMGQMVSRINRHKPDFIGIDFIQQCVEDENNIRLELTKIFRSMKFILKKNKAHSVICSQLKRDAEYSQSPQLSDLYESDAIGQYADNALLLWYQYKEEADDRFRNRMEVYIRKARMGSDGRTTLQCDLGTCTFN